MLECNTNCVEKLHHLGIFLYNSTAQAATATTANIAPPWTISRLNLFRIERGIFAILNVLSIKLFYCISSTIYQSDIFFLCLSIIVIKSFFMFFVSECCNTRKEVIDIFFKFCNPIHHCLFPLLSEFVKLLNGLFFLVSFFTNCRNYDDNRSQNWICFPSGWQN